LLHGVNVITNGFGEFGELLPAWSAFDLPDVLHTCIKCMVRCLSFQFLLRIPFVTLLLHSQRFFIKILCWELSIF